MATAIVLVPFLLFLLTGMRIGTILLAIGVLGTFVLYGQNTMTGMLQNDPFITVAAYGLTPIPLFIFMAYCIMQANIVDNMYLVAYKISRGRPSLLGVVTIFIGGFLGAVSGSGAAIAAALGKIIAPQLQRHGFSPALAAATTATGGSLAAIIPPSIILIIYGSLTETSVGKLFMGALIPGLLLMIVYAVCVVVTYNIFERRKEPEKRDSQELNVHSGFNDHIENSKEEIKSIAISCVMGVMLIAIVLGGIYTGIFTPTEAAAAATFVSLLYCAGLGRLNMDFLKKALKETASITAMIMFIILTAQLFGRLVSLLKIPATIISLLDPILDMTLLVVILLMLFYFILGMFLEGAAAMIMAVPITYPLMEVIGVEPLWFGVMIGMLLCLGLITPPIGLSVFSASGVTGVPLTSIFRYTIVFGAIGMVVVGGLMWFFPEIALWLPSQMAG